MDWRTLLEERNRRAAQKNYGAFLPSSVMATVKAPDAPQEAEPDAGFFGNLAKGAGDVVGFFGNMIKDVGDKAVDTVTGITDVATGQAKAADLEQNTRKLQSITKENSDFQSTLSPEDYDRPDVKAKLSEYSNRAKQVEEAGRNIIKSKEWKASQAVDATKVAASAAETFLNVAGGAGILKAVGKGVAKQGAKMLGKEIVTQSADDVAAKLATSTAINAANRTGVGALKTVGKNALEGSLFGAGYGALQPLEREGKNVKSGDIWQQALMGGAIGGAFGGGLSLLDKNVRAGLKQLPADMKTNTLKTAARNAEVQSMPLQALTSYEGAPDRARVDFYKQKIAAGEQLDPIIAMRDSTGNLGVEDGKHRLQAYIESGINDAPVQVVSPRDIRSVTQGGYIKIPGGKGNAIDDATNAAEQARRQLGGEDVSGGPLTGPNEQMIQSEAARVANAKDYENEMVDYIWGRNKKGKGVETHQFEDLTPGQGGDSYTARRISQNEPFYRAYYEQYGSKPTKKEITKLVDDYLNGGDNIAKFEIHPEQREVFSLIKDREAGLQRTMEAGPPTDLYPQFSNDLGLPTTATPRVAGKAKALEVPTNPSAGFEPSQRALNGQIAAETNPKIDFIDTSVLPSARKRVGVQTAMPENPNPYAGMPQDLTLPALPAGEVKLPSPKVAKTQFKKDQQVVDFLNKQKPGSKSIELPSNIDDWGNIATRQTPAGKLKPLATNNAHITADDVAAIRAIAADDTAGSFTTFRTPEMNLAEALKKRGGEKAPEFRVLDKFNTSIREHTAQYVGDVQEKRAFLENFMKTYKVDGKSAQAMRPYLEAAPGEASDEALKQFAAAFGLDKAGGLQELRTWWRTTAADVRNTTNEVIKTYAGEKRMIGDLGETYLPRVYKSGKPGFKQSALDLVHSKMEQLGGNNGLFNLKNGEGYLNKETESFGGTLRNTEGIPLNSEIAKPNTTFLSAAQKRTARSPIREMEDPITSMMRYFEATGRAKYYTEDIARGRTLQKAIEYVNNDTNNLRQMYNSFNDQINSIAGKTSRIDRPFVDNATGAKFVNVATRLQSKIARSTILGSASSAVAQTGQLPLIAAEAGPKNFAAGMSDMFKFLRNKVDDPMAGSALMNARYPAAEDLFAVSKGAKLANKATDAIAKPFRLIEKASSDLAWRSSYQRALADGFAGKEAVQEADRIAAKIIGERSAGARAAIYESKALSPITSYTLEVNQLYQVAKQYFKNDPKKAAQLVGAIWLYNQGYQAVTGNRLNADPLQAVGEAGGMLLQGTDDNGEPIGLGERLIRASGRLAGEAVDATPLGGPVLGQLYPEKGFRIPFAGGARTLAAKDVFGDTNFGRYGGGTPIASGIANPLLMLGIPGASQLQRSVEGNAAYNKGASVSPAGETRFTVNQDPENYWRSLLFGMYNTKEGRAYLQSQNRNLAGL